MKILVTGCNGFLGSALMQQLRNDKDHQVFGATRHSDAQTSKSPNLISVRNLSKLEFNNLDVPVPDVVVHTVGKAHSKPRLTQAERQTYYDVNVGLALDVAESAARAGVKRLIFISSSKARQFAEMNKGFEAKAERLVSKDPYGESKLIAEHRLLNMKRHPELEIVIIRPPLIYGPGVKGNLRKLIKLIQLGVPVPLASLSKNRKSMVSVANLTSLVETCLTHPNAPGGIFAVSDARDLSTSEILQNMIISSGSSARLIHFPITALKWLAWLFAKSEVFETLTETSVEDIQQTCTELGWQPRYSVEDGFRDMFPFPSP